MIVMYSPGLNLILGKKIVSCIQKLINNSWAYLQPIKTLIKRHVHELYIPIKHSLLVSFIWRILIRHSLFFLYATIFLSQFEPLFGLPRDTLLLNIFEAVQKTHASCFYTLIKHCCSFLKHYIYTCKIYMYMYLWDNQDWQQFSLNA